MKICIILGARPEIIKLSPLIQLLKKAKMNFFIIHTNQHKIYSMERQFFKDFKIKPDYILSTNKDFLSESINQILKISTKEKPDYIINQGDTYSVLASSIAFKNIEKNKCKLVRLEAGLRSYDRSMPEEIKCYCTTERWHWLFQRVSPMSCMILWMNILACNGWFKFFMHNTLQLQQMSSETIQTQ